MRQGQAIGRTSGRRQNASSRGAPGMAKFLAAAAKVLASASMTLGLMFPAAAKPATPASSLAIAATSATPAPVRFYANRLADRAIPGALDLQPIVVAQQSGFLVNDISGPPAEPLPLEIDLPPENGDLFRVIMVRGLPKGFKLSGGVSLDDAWALSPAEINGISLTAPAGYQGTFSMEVLFIRGNGEEREQQLVNVRISPEPEPQRDATGAAQAQSPAQATTQPKIAPEMQASMFDRAERMMAGGDIVGARLILSYLADQGVAGAAFAMGQSYDPGFLQEIYVRGKDPSNVEIAREWYRRAAQMGSEDARSRLTALE